QRLDGTWAVGPEPIIDWTPYLKGGDVYLFEPDYGEIRLTFDGAAGSAQYMGQPILSGLRLTYLRRSVADGSLQRIRRRLVGKITTAAGVARIRHVPSTGQSLSIGASGGGVLTTPAPSARVLMFNGEVKTLGLLHGKEQVDMALSPDRLVDFLPAAERAIGGWGETTMTQAGLRYAQGLPASDAVLVSAHGIGSAAYAELKQGTQPYKNLLTAVEAGRFNALTAGYAHVCDTVIWDQGEGDVGAAAGHRLAALVELQANLTTDINALTGGAGQVALIAAQTSNFTRYGFTTIRPLQQEQLLAAIQNPGKIITPGPKYQHTYTGGDDGTHLTFIGYAREGAEQGRMASRRTAGLDTLPLYMTSAVASGGTIAVTFRIPADTSWEINTDLVSDPGNRGVSIHAADGSIASGVTITSVTQTGAGRLAVAYSGTLPAGAQVGIAAAGIAGAFAGPTTGPRSNFCAVVTDGWTYYDGTPIRMWACHQLLAIA
ncbi:hypothetical protein, partial [Methylorubrum extorquens]|uniref:hypothetical protein n=1 Tax=Methylorubrum extorquens TaxID=408 RepID=UPI001AEE583B